MNIFRLWRYFGLRALKIDHEYKTLRVEYQKLLNLCKEQKQLLAQCSALLEEKL